MSYDLYFFKRKESKITEIEVANYLSTNLVAEQNSQWIFQNNDTEVYFIFEKNETETDEEEIEFEENYEDFESLNFMFILNFLRPSFFGIEAFEFIEKMISDLDIYISNPQSDKEIPYKPKKEELFENWNSTNLSSSSQHFAEQNSYLEIEKSNEIWKYNFHRNQIQDNLGGNYFVPKMFFFKTKSENKVITVSSWTEHIPNVFPPADYFLLTKVQKKLFRTVQENILLSRENLLNRFGEYLNDYEYSNCKIIHPENAKKIKDLFNSTKSELNLENFAERIQIENLFNKKQSE
jgi:hypothetical protein